MVDSAGLDSRDSSCFVDLVDARTDGLELSLKLYHGSELQVGYQQSIAETPRDICGTDCRHAYPRHACPTPVMSSIYLASLKWKSNSGLQPVRYDFKWLSEVDTQEWCVGWRSTFVAVGLPGSCSTNWTLAFSPLVIAVGWTA